MPSASKRMPTKKPSATKLPPASLRMKVLSVAEALIVIGAVLATGAKISSSPLAVSLASAPLTVSTVGVTPVTKNVPLLAAMLKPEIVIFCPTLKPSCTKPPKPARPIRPMSERVKLSVAASATSVPLAQPIAATGVGSSGNARRKVS